jgi:NAD(P)-dependent dehydrogenase (short-subunit alcohol dehydrogenase family)
VKSGEFEGKTALVTGAGSGIGRATACLFALRGAAIVVADIDDGAAAETMRKIEQIEGKAVYVRTDVTQDEDCMRLVDRTLKRFGRLDIAFNNAGIVDSPPTFTADMTPATWQRVLGVNLTGVFNAMRYEIRAMQMHGGAIVNTSSIMGTRGTAGGAAYCASKHGVIGLTRAAALEYGRNGIRINTICPGYIATPLTTGECSVFPREHIDAAVRLSAIRRLGQAEEVAAMVAWLCSSEASFVTGGHFPLDGGISAR